MRRLLVRVILGLLVLCGGVAGSAPAQQTMKTERGEHPRIARAIREMEDAIRYMEAAPHDFGGHKAAALQSSRQAVRDLREALAFRAQQDNKK